MPPAVPRRKPPLGSGGTWRQGGNDRGAGMGIGQRGWWRAGWCWRCWRRIASARDAAPAAPAAALAGGDAARPGAGPGPRRRAAAAGLPGRPGGAGLAGLARRLRGRIGGRPRPSVLAGYVAAHPGPRHAGRRRPGRGAAGKKCRTCWPRCANCAPIDAGAGHASMPIRCRPPASSAPCCGRC